MKYTKQSLGWVLAATMLLFSGAAWGREGKAPYRVYNLLRVEWDDNIRQQKDDTASSLVITEALELTLDLTRPATYLSLRYRPSLTWHENRREDRTDLYHAFDLILNHSFSERVSVSLTDSLRYTEYPELIERDVVVRQHNDYFYNAVNGSLAVALKPDLAAHLSASHSLIRYDLNDVASRQDYDIVSGGVSLRQQFTPSTSASGQLRAESTSYSKDLDVDRGSQSIHAGGSLEHAFNRNLLASISLGLLRIEYDDALTDNQHSPYGEAGMTYLFSPKTRVSSGVSYSTMETDVFPYSSQERLRLYASLGHDLTARVAFYLSSTFTRGNYEAETLPQGARLRDLPTKVRRDWGVTPEMMDLRLADEYVDQITDHTEDVFAWSARATYQLNRSNWLEAGWQFHLFDSELREDFDRNRVYLSWRVRLF